MGEGGEVAEMRWDTRARKLDDVGLGEQMRVMCAEISAREGAGRREGGWRGDEREEMRGGEVERGEEISLLNFCLPVMQQHPPPPPPSLAWRDPSCFKAVYHFVLNPSFSLFYFKPRSIMPRCRPLAQQNIATRSVIVLMYTHSRKCNLHSHLYARKQKQTLKMMFTRWTICVVYIPSIVVFTLQGSTWLDWVWGAWGGSISK